MADAGNAILYILTNNAGVGDVAGDRIYRDELPQEPTYPAITFQLISSPPMPDHNPGPAVNFRNVYQVDCWGETTDDASDLKAAVFAALDSQKGTFAGVNVLGLFYDNDRDLIDAEPKVYGRSQDFVMFTQE